MSKRVKIGDIVEITTPKGYAYAQYTHKHSTYGALIRVLKGIFKEKPENLLDLISEGYQFITFFPLGAADNRGIVHIVGNLPLPEKSRDFPVFKAGTPNSNGKVEIWWLWDGEKEWKVGELKEEQKDFPPRGVINDTLLVERISNGWSHRDAA
jgi:hypothetical protein